MKRKNEVKNWRVSADRIVHYEGYISIIHQRCIRELRSIDKASQSLSNFPCSSWFFSHILRDRILV